MIVEDFARPAPVDFRTDVIAALSRAGCNQGACHGSPHGKNGFHLSLRGYDPEADFKTLTRDEMGRRTNRVVPEDSLILLKGGARAASGRRSLSVRRSCLSRGSWLDSRGLSSECHCRKAHPP